MRGRIIYAYKCWLHRERLENGSFLVRAARILVRACKKEGGQALRQVCVDAHAHMI